MDGNEAQVVPILDYEFDTEYLVTKLPVAIAATPGSHYTFRFWYFRNTPYANNAAHLQFFAWSNRIKILAGQLAPTAVSVDGGIRGVDV